MLARDLGAPVIPLRTVALSPIVALRTIVALSAIVTLGSVVALLPPAALAFALPGILLAIALLTVVGLAAILLPAVAIAAPLLARADWFALVAVIVVAIQIDVVALVALLRLLILEPAALVGEHAEIVIGELEVIFGVDPIALPLRVGGEIAIFLEHLRRIATRAVVDAVAAVAAALAAGPRIAVAAATVIAAPAAPAAVLPIVDQAVVSLALKTKLALLRSYGANLPASQPATRAGACHDRRTAAAP